MVSEDHLFIKMEECRDYFHSFTEDTIYILNVDKIIFESSVSSSLQ